MGLYWNPWAVTGALAMVLGCSLAFVIYFTNPRRLQNRTLALFLACISIGSGVGVGWMFASDDVPTSLALQAVSLAGFYAATPFYLLFLSTLPTRTMAWLRPTPVRAVLWLLPVVTVPLMVVNFDHIVAGVIEVPYARFDSYWTPLGTRIFEVQAIVTATLGIVAALGAWLESSPGSPTRHQAKWYAATFIVWEVLQLSAFTILEVAFRSSQPSVALYTAAAAIIMPGASLLFVLMLAYSILKTQLFDIDLKIKWTINRGTLVGVFLAVFFVVGVIAENWLTERFGLAIGGMAAGLLLFALNPLQRFADRVSDRAMPHVHDTEEYRLVRKREVYLSALESALLDGAISDRERDVLATLADQLGISAGDARALEREVAVPAVPK